MAWCFQEILNPRKQWLKTANSFQVLTLKYIYSTKCLIGSNSFNCHNTLGSSCYYLLSTDKATGTQKVEVIWVPKNWCFWTMGWRRLLRVIQPVHPKGDQSWTFTGRTDAEAETPLLWLPDAKSWFIRKDPDAGKDWRPEKGTTKDEMVGWHHWLNEHEFEQASRKWCRTGKPGMLQSMGLQRVRHNWATEQQFTYKTDLPCCAPATNTTL